MRFNRIYVEITNRCNLSCSFCSKSERPLKQMSVDNFKKILEKIIPYTKTICLHVKGEPLLHSEFNQILQECDKYNFNVFLTTNAIFLNYWIDIINHTNCIKKIHISLHCENTIDNYVEKVCQSVDKLKKSIIIVYRLWALKDNKLDKKSTELVGKLQKHYDFSTELVEKIKTGKNIEIDKNKYVDKDSLFTWPILGNQTIHSFCCGLKTHIAILSDGTIVPCCLDGEGIIYLGNIFEDNLDQILQSKRVQEIIKGFQENKAIELLCQNCTYKQRFQ